MQVTVVVVTTVVATALLLVRNTDKLTAALDAFVGVLATLAADSASATQIQARWLHARMGWRRGMRGSAARAAVRCTCLGNKPCTSWGKRLAMRTLAKPPPPRCVQAVVDDMQSFSQDRLSSLLVPMALAIGSNDTWAWSQAQTQRLSDTCDCPAKLGGEWTAAHSRRRCSAPGLTGGTARAAFAGRGRNEHTTGSRPAVAYPSLPRPNAPQG